VLPDAAIEEPPFVIRWEPSGGDSSVETDVIVSATFNEPVTGISTYSFKLIRHDTDTWHAAYVYYDDATRTASLHPQTSLDPTRTYVATLGPDIVDLHGMQLVGTTSWMFSIAPDTMPPAVTHTLPIAGAVNVPVDTTIVATLSEQVFVTNASFILANSSGTVFAAVSPVPAINVSLTPSVQLAPHTVYSVSLTAAVKDYAGNALLGAPVEWTFTTGADTIAPAVVSRSPEIDDSGIPLIANVTVRFSEPVTGVSTATMTLDHAGSLVPASVTYSASSRLARLTPTAPLAPNTTYTITLTSAIADASGNALAPVTWSFETGSGI